MRLLPKLSALRMLGLTRSTRRPGTSARRLPPTWKSMVSSRKKPVRSVVVSGKGCCVDESEVEENGCSFLVCSSSRRTSAGGCPAASRPTLVKPTCRVCSARCRAPAAGVVRVAKVQRVGHVVHVRVLQVDAGVQHVDQAAGARRPGVGRGGRSARSVRAFWRRCAGHGGGRGVPGLEAARRSACGRCRRRSRACAARSRARCP